MPHKDTEKRREYARKYYERTREKRLESRRKSYQKNREKCLAYQREWREENPGHHREYMRTHPKARALRSLASQEYAARNREWKQESDRRNYHKRRAAGLAEMDQIVAELGGTPLV